jgi:hypothetical protein
MKYILWKKSSTIYDVFRRTVGPPSETGLARAALEVNIEGNRRSLMIPRSGSAPEQSAANRVSSSSQARLGVEELPLGIKVHVRVEFPGQTAVSRTPIAIRDTL